MYRWRRLGDLLKVTSNVIGEKVVGVKDHHPVLAVLAVENYRGLSGPCGITLGLSEPLIEGTSFDPLALQMQSGYIGDNVRAVSPAGKLLTAPGLISILS